MNRESGRYSRALGTVACVAVLLLAWGCDKATEKTPATSTGRTTLRVFVPCGMELPFMAAQAAFQRSHPMVAVDVVLDNANILVRRVLDKDEKTDLIVSPGTVEMDRMTEAGAVRQQDVTPFGQYELVLFTSRDNPAGVQKITDLTKAEVKSISIPDPDLNSVGRYIREALTAQSLWEQLRPKMTFTDHPITAYKHVAQGKADASFAYRSCPLKTAPEKLEYSKVRILETVPKTTYGPAYACIAPLLNAAQPTLAQDFITFLMSPEGQALLRENNVPPLVKQGDTDVQDPSAATTEPQT